MGNSRFLRKYIKEGKRTCYELKGLIELVCDVDSCSRLGASQGLYTIVWQMLQFRTGMEKT